MTHVLKKLELKLTSGSHKRLDGEVHVHFGPDGVTPLDNKPRLGLFKLSGEAEKSIELGAGKRGRLYFPFEVVGGSGVGKLLFSGTGGLLTDKVERSIPVVPFGFPRDFAKSGTAS